MIEMFIPRNTGCSNSVSRTAELNIRITNKTEERTELRQIV